MRRGLGAAAAAGLIVMALTGCGGSDGGATAASKPALSPQARFVKAANAICTEARKLLVAPTTKDKVKYIDSVIAWQQRKVERMSAVRPPHTLQRGYDRYMAALRARENLLERYAKIVRAGRTPGRIDNTAATMWGHERAQASKLGLETNCGV